MWTRWVASGRGTFIGVAKPGVARVRIGEPASTCDDVPQSTNTTAPAAVSQDSHESSKCVLSCAVSMIGDNCSERRSLSKSTSHLGKNRRAENGSNGARARTG